MAAQLERLAAVAQGRRKALFERTARLSRAFERAKMGLHDSDWRYRVECFSSSGKPSLGLRLGLKQMSYIETLPQTSDVFEYGGHFTQLAGI